MGVSPDHRHPEHVLRGRLSTRWTWRWGWTDGHCSQFHPPDDPVFAEGSNVYIWRHAAPSSWRYEATTNPKCWLHNFVFVHIVTFLYKGVLSFPKYLTTSKVLCFAELVKGSCFLPSDHLTPVIGIWLAVHYISCAWCLHEVGIALIKPIIFNVESISVLLFYQREWMVCGPLDHSVPFATPESFSPLSGFILSPSRSADAFCVSHFAKQTAMSYAEDLCFF